MSIVFKLFHSIITRLLKKMRQINEKYAIEIIKLITLDKEDTENNINIFKEKRNANAPYLKLFDNYVDGIEWNTIKNVLYNIFKYSEDVLKDELVKNKIIPDRQTEIVKELRIIKEDYDKNMEDKEEIELHIENVLDAIILNRIHICDYRKRSDIKNEFGSYNSLHRVLAVILLYVDNFIKAITYGDREMELKWEKDNISSNDLLNLDKENEVYGFRSCFTGVMNYFQLRNFAYEKRELGEELNKEEEYILNWSYDTDDKDRRFKIFFEYFVYWFDIKGWDMHFSDFIDVVYDNMSKYWVIDEVPFDIEKDLLEKKIFEMLENMKQYELSKGVLYDNTIRNLNYIEIMRDMESEKDLDKELLDNKKFQILLDMKRAYDIDNDSDLNLSNPLKYEFEGFFNNLIFKMNILKSGKKPMFYDDMHSYEISWIQFFIGGEYDKKKFYMFQYYLDSLFIAHKKIVKNEVINIQKTLLVQKVDWKNMSIYSDKDDQLIKKGKIDYFRSLNKIFERSLEILSDNLLWICGIDAFLFCISICSKSTFDNYFYKFGYYKKESIWEERKSLECRLTRDAFFNKKYENEIKKAQSEE